MNGDLKHGIGMYTDSFELTYLGELDNDQAEGEGVVIDANRIMVN